ncbi:9286_t:CDS:2, partial [Scutellospora calospora]
PINEPHIKYLRNQNKPRSFLKNFSYYLMSTQEDDDDSERYSIQPAQISDDGYLTADIVNEFDTSKIPFKYQLSLRNLYAINDRYDYIITSYPVQESNITTLDEDRYLPNGTIYRVVTAIAYSTWFYIAWGPPVTIKFITTPTEIAYNETVYYNNQDLITCEYEFSWTFILNGYVNRKCENESTFSVISYVKGSNLFGFTFYSYDEKKVYAHTTIPDLAVWDFFRRSVFIDHNAPFPSLIPALYTAYYDWIVNMRSTFTF